LHSLVITLGIRIGGKGEFDRYVNLNVCRTLPLPYADPKFEIGMVCLLVLSLPVRKSLLFLLSFFFHLLLPRS